MMFGYAIVAVLAVCLFWLDPILNAVAPSLVPKAPVMYRTPRPPVKESLLALEDGDVGSGSSSCPPDAYTVHLFNKAPLVMYIENFLSLSERQHLIEIRSVFGSPRERQEVNRFPSLRHPEDTLEADRAASNALYEPATVTSDGGGSVQRDTIVRDSEVAIVPRTDVVRCIEARARSLQGWREDLWIERLRVQRYVAPSGHYGFHFDWSRPGTATGGWGRVSSIMVYVDDGELNSPNEPRQPLVGGGTYFPRVPRRSADFRWCPFINCEGDAEVEVEDEGEDGQDGYRPPQNNTTTGVVFKPVPGNAVLWENFRSDGTGRPFEETWHAGLRVLEGVKVGLNIWSWGRMD
ncbi:2og-Fe oxygenase family protein [Grosmannia clavigera kw1407]|uniref:2og-Fe oxygenase family protein n=1 Tax=Grosmannia clavigera (strain kw1407 / UAMH 11150) TaxID=655863 RepID=F0XGZ2_GROCL|nr:2og-Fe oxygenase family protein [Grosmannia clavigera kw1407]EFX02851.1 2og-Fe oxygenase family protein [Grosmannia clavigera kw1407]